MNLRKTPIASAVALALMGVVYPVHAQEQDAATAIPATQTGKVDKARADKSKAKAKASKQSGAAADPAPSATTGGVTASANASDAAGPSNTVGTGVSSSTAASTGISASTAAILR